jgi:hypothetical protein
MNEQGTGRSVERLFPFVLRSRILLVGRTTLMHKKGRLHFVLITRDVSEPIRAEVLSEFAHYPVVQHYQSAELEQFFGVKGSKVIGFQKSGLAQSIYAELKQHRINKPVSRETVPGGEKPAAADMPSKAEDPGLPT